MSNDDPALTVGTASGSLTGSATTSKRGVEAASGEQADQTNRLKQHDDDGDHVGKPRGDIASGENEQVMAATSGATVTVAADVYDDGRVDKDLIPHQSDVLPPAASSILEQVEVDVPCHNAETSKDSSRSVTEEHAASHQQEEDYTIQRVQDVTASGTLGGPDSTATHIADSTILPASDIPGRETAFAPADSTSAPRQPYSIDVASVAMTPDASGISVGSRTSTGIDTGSGTDSGLQDTSVDATTAAPSSSSPVVQTRPAPAKKFTSSLSMNKKFLEKSGLASDGKSPILTLPIASKAALGQILMSARSASAGSPGAGTSVTTASPTLTTPGSSIPTPSTSAPKLLTGKLSVLGSAGAPAAAGTPTWGRPGMATLKSGTSFGKAGFVPAPAVNGQGQIPPPPNRGQQMPGGLRGKAFPALGKAPPGHIPSMQQPQSGYQQGGTRSGSSLESDFPTFGETARAEVQRQHAMVAKQKADQLAAEATVAYNQRVLDGLKAFSGIHSDPNAAHWDEMDDDDDLGDVLEFADGMRYEVDHLPLPNIAEKGTSAEAQAAQREAASLQYKYEQEIAAPAMSSEKSGESSDKLARKSDRFVDDFDRLLRSDVPASSSTSTSRPSLVTTGQPGNRQSSATGKTLFNDRLGRLEPYTGKPQTVKKEVKSPASVMQRHASIAEQAANTNRIDGARVKSNAGLATLKDAQAVNRSVSAPAPVKKVENVWVKQQIAVAAPSLAEIAKEEASKKLAVSANSKEVKLTPVPAVTAISTPQVMQPPTVPAVDPEAAYRAQMQENAERARKRRVEAEQEREAQAERARKKAQELTDRLTGAENETTSITTTAILLPPVLDRAPDRAANWRRAPANPALEQPSRPPQAITRTLLQPERASLTSNNRQMTQHLLASNPIEPTSPSSNSNPTVASALKSSTSAPLSPTGASSTKVPSSASFAALANFTQSIWSKPAQRSVPTPPESTKVQQTDIAISKPLAGPTPIILPISQDSFAASTPSIKQLTGCEEQSILSRDPIPRVRLNRSPVVSLSQPPAANSLNATSSTCQASQHVAAQTSALDKLMQQVRAAQSGMQAEKAEASKQRALTHGQDRRQGNAAMSRSWREPKPLAEIEETLFAKYVPEAFEQSAVERPASPRFWKTFSTKLPSRGKSLQDILPHRLLSFQSAHNPSPVSTSSWYRPRDHHATHQSNVGLEAHLHPRNTDDTRYIVKFSRLFPVADDQKPEFQATDNTDPASSTQSVPQVSSKHELLAQLPLPNGLHSSLATDEQDDFGASTYAPLLEVSQSITVALPKKTVADLIVDEFQSHTDEDDFATSRRLLTPDFTRFRSYGPKLPQNSTVAFRRNLTAAVGSAPSSLEMFMVSSEIGDAGDRVFSQSGNVAPAYNVPPDQTWSTGPMFNTSGPSEAVSKMTNGTSSVPASHFELTDIDNLSFEAQGTEGQAAFATMKREDLPKHVVDELERLNATVGVQPSVQSLRDSPSFGHRISSPWASNLRNGGLSSALSMVGLDPSMSMWSKPTEETAAAAAAAGHKTRDDTRLDSLDGMMDDFPSSMMPSSANDLPLGDGDSVMDGYHQSPQASEKDRARLGSAAGKQSFQRRPSMTSPAVISRALGDLQYHRSPASIPRDARFVQAHTHGDSVYSPYMIAGALPQDHSAGAYAHNGASPAPPYVSYAASSPYMSSPGPVAAPGSTAAYPAAFSSASGQPLFRGTVIPTAHQAPNGTVWMQTADGSLFNVPYTSTYATMPNQQRAYATSATLPTTKQRLAGGQAGPYTIGHGQYAQGYAYGSTGTPSHVYGFQSPPIAYGASSGPRMTRGRSGSQSYPRRSGLPSAHGAAQW